MRTLWARSRSYKEKDQNWRPLCGLLNGFGKHTSNKVATLGVWFSELTCRFRICKRHGWVSSAGCRLLQHECFNQNCVWVRMCPANLRESKSVMRWKRGRNCMLRSMMRRRFLMMPELAKREWWRQVICKNRRSRKVEDKKALAPAAFSKRKGKGRAAPKSLSA